MSVRDSDVKKAFLADKALKVPVGYIFGEDDDRYPEEVRGMKLWNLASGLRLFVNHIEGLPYERPKLYLRRSQNVVCLFVELVCLTETKNDGHSNQRTFIDNDYVLTFRTHIVCLSSYIEKGDHLKLR